MVRRVHVTEVVKGESRVERAQSHHISEVLRLVAGDEVEVFDAAGNVGHGTVVRVGDEVVVRIGEVERAGEGGLRLVVASAIPKGSRADWMIEKLSELGVAEFVPLASERSVVHPEGKNKLERWQRLAIEAAKQSRRSGVMKIGAMMKVAEMAEKVKGEKLVGWFLSTGDEVVGVMRAVEEVTKLAEKRKDIIAMIGPEGGWTEEEEGTFVKAGMRGVGLTRTVLRVETAAVATAAVLMSMMRG